MYLQVINNSTRFWKFTVTLLHLERDIQLSQSNASACNH